MYDVSLTPKLTLDTSDIVTFEDQLLKRALDFVQTHTARV